MNIKSLSIGMKLEVEVAGNSYGKTYASQLEEIVDDENIAISCPIFESKYVFIATGSTIKLVFFHEQHGLWLFRAVITSKVKNGPLLLLYAKITGDFERIQRRNFYRLDCNLAARYHIRTYQGLKKEETPNEPNREFISAITRNLSGNGACIVCDEHIPKDSFIDVELYISDNAHIKAFCRVMRASEINTTKGSRYEHGLYFLELSPRDHDMLVKYIFDQQRLLLKRNI